VGKSLAMFRGISPEAGWYGDCPDGCGCGVREDLLLGAGLGAGAGGAGAGDDEEFEMDEAVSLSDLGAGGAR
jgi:hypothetical protein